MLSGVIARVRLETAHRTTAGCSSSGLLAISLSPDPKECLMIRSFLLALALCIALVGVPASAASAATDWEQRGGDIDGATAGDESVYSVALSADGRTVATGAPS